MPKFPKNKIIFLTAIIFLGLLFFAKSSLAATCTHYVSTSGAATWANATNISTPCSVQTAFSNAVADNVVCLRGGTYNVGTDGGDGYTGALNPANSGTSGHPITFQAYPGEIPILNGDWNNNANEHCVVLGTGDGAVNWITYDGFTTTANAGVRTGVIVVGGSGYPGGTGFVIKNCTVVAGSTAFTIDDNRTGIGSANANIVTMSNNITSGFTMSGGSIDNFSGIKIYRTGNLTISNNKIYGCLAAISFKRFSSDVIISYNI